MVVVAAIEDLVVRLPVVRTEHQAKQREVQLVAQREVLLFDVEAVGGDACRHEVQSDTSLGGVVRRAHVVEEAEIEIRQAASL